MLAALVGSMLRGTLIDCCSVPTIRTNCEVCTLRPMTLPELVATANDEISLETLEALLPEDLFSREPLPWPAAFLAGKAFLAYRRRGGARRSPLPDFYIGAHAAVRGYRLLTRDRARYATYFPTLDLIAPATT